MSVRSYLDRLRTGWLTRDAARRGPTTVGSVGIDITADTTQFEASLDRARARLEDLQEAAALPGPPVILKVAHRLSESEGDRMRRSFAEGLRDGKVIVLDGGVKTFQMVDGRWSPIEEG